MRILRLWQEAKKILWNEIFNCRFFFNFSGFTSVIPVVGEVKNFEPKSLVVNKDEVYDYFVKGVYELHNHNIAGYTQFRHWKNPNSKPGYSLPIYNCEPYPIWGVTALITLQFLSVFLKGRTKGFNHAINFQTPIHMIS